MTISQILSYVSALFSGYAIGRLGHMYFSYVKFLHHWIYGFLLILAAPFFYENQLGIPAFLFGTGLFVSDFRDFLALKFIGMDRQGKKKFWGID